MALPAVGTTDISALDGEAKIDALLGGGGSQQPTSDGADRAAEDTSVADADLAPEGEETAEGAEEAEGASEEEGAEGSEEESGETEFELTEQDSDFSDNAYTRAAEHYSKQFGKTLDPNDKADRAILRELIQRGQRIKALQSEEAPEEETEEAEAGDKGKTEEVKPAQPVKLTVEQIKERVQQARKYAGDSLVPEVSLDFAQSFVKALWGDKAPQLKQEQADEITKAFSTFGSLLIADAIPHILGAVPTAVMNGVPMMRNVVDMASREAAVDEVLGITNKGGQPAYPEFEKLVESGAIRKAMQGPELKDAVFSRDPQKNLVAKLKIAYKLAKGQGVDVEALEKASKAGRASEQERARRVAAGRTPPGSSRGGAAGPATASNFIGRLVSGSGSKFARAIAESHKK